MPYPENYKNNSNGAKQFRKTDVSKATGGMLCSAAMNARVSLLDGKGVGYNDSIG